MVAELDNLTVREVQKVDMDNALDNQVVEVEQELTGIEVVLDSQALLVLQ